MTDTHSKALTEGSTMTTTQQPETDKTIDLDAMIGAKIETVNLGMPATHRCDMCGAQAYVEAEMNDQGGAYEKYGLPETGERKKRTLLFCAHHYTKNEVALSMQAARIVDHRPFLATQERMYKGMAPA